MTGGYQKLSTFTLLRREERPFEALSGHALTFEMSTPPENYLLITTAVATLVFKDSKPQGDGKLQSILQITVDLSA